MDSSDPKTMLMQQVKQEAALNNARQLIEVLVSVLDAIWIALIGWVEIERALLRQVHSKARSHLLFRRAAVLLNVHGEVHGNLEHGQQTICRQNSG